MTDLQNPPPDLDDTGEPDSPDETAADGSVGNGDVSILWLSIALVILVGGVVYVVGAVMRAGRETNAAEQRAEQVLEAYDPDEFTSELADNGSDPLDESVTPTTTTAPPETTIAPTRAVATPHPGVDIVPSDIVMAFVGRVPGDDYGKVGYVDRDGTRHSTELECARLDLNASAGLCLTVDGGVSQSGNGLITDAALVPNSTFGLNMPSRAAVSPQGDVVAWTGFTLGHSYLNEGEFATITQLISVDRRVAANLESAFTTYWNGQRWGAADRNYWGVTFVDSDHFYATMSSEGVTSIVEGRVSESRMDVVFEGASCPAVSPDGTTLVVKERRDGDHFQLVAIDIATGERRDLGETRSVDDQVEWIDDDTIVYGLPNPDEGTDAQPVFDIWVLDVTPGGTPRLLLPFADSPAV